MGKRIQDPRDDFDIVFIFLLMAAPMYMWFPETKFVCVQLFTDHAINVVTRDMKSDSAGQY